MSNITMYMYMYMGKTAKNLSQKRGSNVAKEIFNKSKQGF